MIKEVLKSLPQILFKSARSKEIWFIKKRRFTYIDSYRFRSVISVVISNEEMHS